MRALAPDGEIGAVWTIRRALVYRIVEQLIASAMIQPAGTQPGERGTPRTLLRITRTGRARFFEWLDEPVPHVRDLRSALLLKLLFAERAGIDTGPLLRAQRVILADTVAALFAPGADDDAQRTVQAFRLETARAGLRFVDGELARSGRHDT